MAGKIIADQLQHSTAGTIDTTYAVEGTLKAWCSWSMNDTNNPYDSFGISSIADTSATINTITYTNAFNTGTGQCVNTATNANAGGVTSVSSSDLQIHTPTTTTITIQCQSNTNPAFNGMQATGDLA